ncbi:MAG: tetratricopeptide repeat protein [Cyanobacteria bacterium J06635_1]
MNLLQFLSAKSEQPLGGRYKVIEPLGEGGFGRTFLAADLHLPDHPKCVIKQLKPHLQDTESMKTARRLFDTEARVLYSLGEHAQIPRLLAHFEDNRDFYLAQELIEGETLSRLMQPGQRWPQVRVLLLLSDILTPLAFVHGQNVIHRDLKPANLIRRRSDGRIVLIDFGAVKQVSDQRTYSGGGATRTISIGTQGYMPNEQLAGNPWFSSDIFAVGMICIQALTGVAPHLLKRDPRTSEILWQTPDLEISDAFEAVLSRMVRYDFRDRYPTAADALAALGGLPGVPTADASGLPATFTDLSTDLPTQIAAPAAPSSEILPSQAKGVEAKTREAPEVADMGTQVLAKSKPDPAKVGHAKPAPWVAKTLAVAKLGLPTLTKSVQTASKTVVAAIPDQFQPAKPKRGSIIGLGIVAMLMLGPIRGWLSPSGSSPIKASAPPVGATALTPAESRPAESTPAEPIAAKPTANDLLIEATDLRDRKQYKAALSVYDKSLALEAGMAEAHWGRCYSLNQLQSYDQAIEACDLALAIAPDHVQALWSKGHALERQDQLEAALALYNQTIELAPDYSEAWNNRGVVQQKLQRSQDALDSFDRALAVNPDFAEAWNNRGAALWSLRRFDEAIASIDKAIALKPDYSDALKLRDQIRQKLGR